jgi:sugar diacid utilization regulator
VVSDPAAHDTERLLDAAVSIAARLPDAAVVHPPRPQPRSHLVVVVPSSPTDWKRRLKIVAEGAVQHGVLALTASPRRGPIALRDSYRAASAALQFARAHLAIGAVPVDRFALRVALNGNPDFLQGWSDCVLRPLLDLPVRERAPLLQTLQAMWSWSGPDEVLAQTRLGVHSNTLRNRMARVRKLTGLDLRLPSAASRLWLALYLHGLVDLAA